VATAFTHAFSAVAIGAIAFPSMPKRALFAGAVLAAAPDVDVVTFKLGIKYEDALGHRGATHSLLFALIVGVAIAAIWFRSDRARMRSAALYFSIALASHGVLDALTNGGLGVGFFIPFHDARYFFPWQPIEVSPISPRRFIDGRAWPVLASEFVVVWIPLGFAWIGALIARRRR